MDTGHVLLQLADDLQDVAEDKAAGMSTLFSEKSTEPLDVVTNRVFEFGELVFAGLDTFHTPGVGPLKQLIRQSAVALLITAAGAAHELHTRPSSGNSSGTRHFVSGSCASTGNTSTVPAAWSAAAWRRYSQLASLGVRQTTH